MTINYYYCKHNCKHYCARQIKKETFESYSQKQGKFFSAGNAMISQNKTNLSLSFTSKKQSNSLQIDLSFKLANNSKLTSDEYKKYLENNLCFYCSLGDHKLDSCPKKQTTVILQFNNLRVDQRKEPYIKFIQENLIKNSVQKYLSFYTKVLWSILLLLQPTLNSHVFVLRSTCIVYII